MKVKKIGIEGSHAAALAVKLARVDVISAYPITPQTHIVEKLSEYVADGEIDAEYINIESEHSALSSCMGAAAVGARTFTSTAGQGLALMHELLFIASGNRLPIVMAVANRCLSPMINIWGDQSDMMASRDCGWIQIYAESAQEILDLVLQAFRLAEDDRILLPVAVNFDGFIATHVIEPIIALDQEEVDKFIPPKKFPEYALNPDTPITLGAFGPPSIETEVKKQMEDALCASKEVFKEIGKEFGQISGRYYDVLETYRIEDAEIAFMIMGASAGTAKAAVDKLREKNIKAGVIKLRVYRPFPKEEIADATRNIKVLAVFDKSFCPGYLGGPLFNDCKASLNNENVKLKVLGFVAGLGGRDITIKDFANAADKSLQILNGAKSSNDFEFLQVRE